MKRTFLISAFVLLSLLTAGCSGAESSDSASASVSSSAKEAGTMTDAKAMTQLQSETAETEGDEMLLKIGDTKVQVNWEDNEAVSALKDIVSRSPVSIQMSMYGGFEQVGSIGQSLPRSDERITTGPGDIVLYSGDQLVVFYGSNSWSYTRLGHISGMSEDELADLLGSGDVIVSIE